jgi:serine protease Do
VVLAVCLALATGPAWAQAPPEFGWLGISIADVGEELADRLAATFGPSEGIGVVVVDVLKGGPAEQAAVKRGDVIVRVDGQPIWDVRQLQRTVRSRPVNQRVLLTVLRESSRETVPVTVGAMPVEARAQLAGERFGFLVREEERRDPLHGQVMQTGRILVTFVEGDSPASRAGLRPQDVILQADDHAISSLEEFDRAMRRAGRQLSLMVERRDGQTRATLSLELPRR